MQVQHDTGRNGGADRSGESGLVMTAPRGLYTDRSAHPVHHFISGNDAEQETRSRRVERFGSSEHRRYDDSARMHGAFVDEIVELESMRRRAIAERGGWRGERLAASDDARPAARAFGQH